MTNDIEVLNYKYLYQLYCVLLFLSFIGIIVLIQTQLFICHHCLVRDNVYLYTSLVRHLLNLQFVATAMALLRLYSHIVINPRGSHCETRKTTKRPAMAS